jgi:thioredoxin-related protein
MSITTEIVELLQKEPMTGKELVIKLDLQEEPNLVHCILTTLKRRKLIKTVAKIKEQTSHGRPRLVSIYSYIEPIKPVKFRAGKNKKRKYRINLTKTKNMNTLRAMIVKSNPQFMLYQKEMKLIWTD